MSTLRTAVLALLGTVLLACAVSAQPPGIAPSAVPHMFGVNIHFTDARPGELKMLAAGGFRWIRMDYAWEAVERERGKYDFSAYDRLLRQLEQHGIHAVFILDYGHRFYDNGLSPASEEARQAFAAWAAASVRHFRGHGILWEMFNEPNIGFWKPKPDAAAYVKLALAVGKAIQATGLKETYIGPATSSIDLKFLETCFQGGLLNYWSAVSVHPYRQSEPESASAEYRQLRALIARYAPRGKQIPIISGEWGYSSGWGGTDEERQGKVLPREFMTNLMNDIPLSIYYDWHEDGTDPKEPEHHFGSVRWEYRAGQDPVYEPKPAYLAARTLATYFAGFRLNKRIAVGSDNDYVLLFQRGKEVRLAAWTIVPDAHEIAIPASAGAFAVTDYLGAPQAAVNAAGGTLRLTVSDGPLYLTPRGRNPLLQAAAAVTRVPMEYRVTAPAVVAVAIGFTNPLDRPVKVRLDGGAARTVPARASVTLTRRVSIARSAVTTSLPVNVTVEGRGTIAQQSVAQVTNPVTLTVSPLLGNTVQAIVSNPSGSPVRGTLRCTAAGVELRRSTVPVNLSAGTREAVIELPAEGTPAGEYRLGLTLTDARGGLIARSGEVRMAAAPLFEGLAAGQGADGFGVYADGDAKVQSTQTLTTTSLPAANGNATALALDYAFDTGWKFVRVAPTTEPLRAIEGKPRAFGLYIHGDGTGNIGRLRFADSTGQTFQPGGAEIRWKGWRFLSIPLDGRDTNHWGGANDGVIHYPIHWDTLFLLDGKGAETRGSVTIACPTFMY